MKPQAPLALLIAFVVPTVIGLQAWTLLSVVDVRERLARLEAMAQARAPARHQALEGRRLGPWPKTVHDGDEQRLKVIRPGESLAHGEP